MGRLQAGDPVGAGAYRQQWEELVRYGAEGPKCERRTQLLGSDDERKAGRNLGKRGAKLLVGE